MPVLWLDRVAAMVCLRNDAGGLCDGADLLVDFSLQVLLGISSLAQQLRLAACVVFGLEGIHTAALAAT
jgi:hypothetical protein